MTTYGYTAGGWVTGTGISAITEKYDDVANTWTAKANLNTARADLAGFSQNGYGYTAGGYVAAVSAVTEKYDDVANTWTAKANLNTARNHLAGFDIPAAAATISGYVKSRSGISFTGALVTISGNEDTTDDNGYYSIANVPLGSNDITVKHSLKKTHSETRTITVDETINFTLYEIKLGKIFSQKGASLEGGTSCGKGKRKVT